MTGFTFYDPFDAGYEARVLADSVSPEHSRLITLEIRFPRFILPEINTVRLFSRNYGSSRAIPTEALIKQVREDPFVPTTFNKRVKGMGIGVEIDGQDAIFSRDAWIQAAMIAADQAQRLVDLDVDKSRANRLLEPFVWLRGIISSTHWANFYALRSPANPQASTTFPAQIEFQQLAILMREAIRASNPEIVVPGEEFWHRPLVDPVEVEGSDIPANGWNMIAARRCARISYDKHTDEEPADVSQGKAQELARAGHWSPFEHIARPITDADLYLSTDISKDKMLLPMDQLEGEDPLADLNPGMVWCGNFQGWAQFRKMFPQEHNHALIIGREEEFVGCR